MQTEDEILNNLMGYFKKLERCIQNEAAFSFGNKKIFDKKRVDDILCCIDASMPSEFAKLANSYGEDKQIRTYKLKRELIANIKVKPPIGNSSYMVNTSETLQLIKSLAGSIPKDLGYIRATYPNL